MKSRFHEAAGAELTEAIAYYDGKASGLGDRFLAVAPIPPVLSTLTAGQGLTVFP